MSLDRQLIIELNSLADKKQAEVLSRFFKTGKGEYGEGDVFLGIKVPVIRKVAYQYLEMDVGEVQTLLDSKIHEIRFAGLSILVIKFDKASKNEQKIIFDIYLENISNNINNWDLVDLSCPQIVGRYVFENNDNAILHKLAQSNNLWEKRVAMIANFYAIKKGFFDDALLIAEKLLYDKHDLINKAVGWMLREIGKRDMSIERRFLEKYHKNMPRVALRYAIEKMDNSERNYFLGKNKA